MPFSDEIVEQLLIACHRRCCVCHRFCGVKMEIDHIIPRAQDGPDTADNGIPVCFECHAEIHMYNDQHPRGRKFRPGELKRHKEQWFDFCKNNAATLSTVPLDMGVGPIQALIDELEFNQEVAKDTQNMGCLFEVKQFDRAMSEGAFSMLPDDIRNALRELYVKIKRANMHIEALRTPTQGNLHSETLNNAQNAILEVNVANSLALLRRYLEQH